MPIYQTNIWICEVCKIVKSITEEVSPTSDPVVLLSDEQWGYICTHDKGEVLACPTCQKLGDW